MQLKNEFNRLMFFELARKTAELTYTKNPLDADNLTRWGGALIELSQFQKVQNSKQMIQDDAKDYFDKASVYFQQAADEDPSNALYQKSLEVAAKAPELHMDLHKHGLTQQAMAAGPLTTTLSTKTSKKKKSNDLKYDIFRFENWRRIALDLMKPQIYLEINLVYICITTLVSLFAAVASDLSLRRSAFKTQNISFCDKSRGVVFALNLKIKSSRSRNPNVICMSVQQASIPKVAVAPLELENAKEPPLNIHKPNEPYTSTIVSVERNCRAKSSWRDLSYCN